MTIEERLLKLKSEFLSIPIRVVERELAKAAADVASQAAADAQQHWNLMQEAELLASANRKLQQQASEQTETITELTARYQSLQTEAVDRIDSLEKHIEQLHRNQRPTTEHLRFDFDTTLHIPAGSRVQVHRS